MSKQSNNPTEPTTPAPAAPAARPQDPSEHALASRRRFLSAAGAIVGGGALAWSLPGCSGGTTTSPGAGDGAAPGKAAPEHEGNPSHVPPGKLDDYYGFWSGGQSGEVRILGIPSMRELKRIPVFNRDSATGWGMTDWSKAALGGMMSGDTHHVHMSYTDGTYDGRYVYVNDKANGRLARIRIATMEVDHVIDLPHCQGTHGIFPQRHKTGLVFCNSEFRNPMPNDGRDLDDPMAYGSLHSAVDGETMELKWQVLVEGAMDLCATDYEGKYSFATCYDSERGVTLEQMMAADLDWLYVFHTANLEKAVAEGKTITIGDSKIPVVDCRAGDNEYCIRIPVPKSPHGVNVSPDGKYAIVSGKLSPTASVIQIDKIADIFAGKIKARDCVVAEPELGLGPLHTAFDGRGNAYTSIFIDSVMTKWNIQKAIDAHNGQKVDPIIEKIDVHYQVGHTNASMSETKEADGKWLVALCKFSKDRFLPTGPLRSENDQLIDISDDKLKLVHDGTAYPEPHDAVIVRRDIINPIKVQDRQDARFAMYAEWAKEDGVELMAANVIIEKGKGKKRIYMTSQAPTFGMTSIRVKAGDELQVVVTNLDNVEDLCHGFCVSRHDVNFLINPQDTQSATFKVGGPGVYWSYCSWFCHALHLEMRGRLLVEA